MNNELYSGLDAEFYDELLDGEIEDLPFWRTLLASISGSALEVGCGTGRILIPLLQDGHGIDGIDNAARMVDLLNVKAARLGLKATVKNQAMEKMEMGKRYNLIFIPGFSLQMVATRALLKQALLGFHRHLESGGQLAVSLFFPWEEMEDLEGGHWRLRKKLKRADGTRLECHQSTFLDLSDQSLVIKNRYLLFDKSRRKMGEEIRDLRLLWFYPHEFHLLLQETGFDLRETYSDFKYEPMDEFTPHAVFLAAKTDP